MRLPHPNDDAPLPALLAARRTVRRFDHTPLSLADTAQLLWAGGGRTADAHRTVPSAGARYPVTLTAVAGAVTDLAAGSYRYDGDQHELIQLASADPRGDLERASLPQPPEATQRWLGEAPLVIVVSADLDATRRHFADQPVSRLGIARGLRYADIETGHAAQNIYLQATALGLGVVLVGGFDDEAVRRLPVLPDPSYDPLALLAVGHPRPSA